MGHFLLTPTRAQKEKSQKRMQTTPITYPPFRQYFNIRDCFYCVFPERFDEYKKRNQDTVKFLSHDEKWAEATSIYFNDLDLEKERRYSGWTRPPRRMVPLVDEQAKEKEATYHSTMTKKLTVIRLLFYLIVFLMVLLFVRVFISSCSLLWYYVLLK